MRNPFSRIDADTIAIELVTDGGGTAATLVDISDLAVVDVVSGSWRAIIHRRTHYARCDVWNGRGIRRGVYMHRLLMEPQAGMVVDHINHDGLDNRRGNLRVVTYGENGLNRRRDLRADNTSGFTGVVRHRASGRWTSRVHRDGKTISLGYYETADEAAAVRVAFLDAQ